MNKKNRTTTLSSEKIQEIQNCYNLGQFLSWNVKIYLYFFDLFFKKVIEGGLANTNCKLVTESGTHLLKICDEKKVEQLEVTICFVVDI